jgi:hypothetical protein
VTAMTGTLRAMCRLILVCSDRASKRTTRPPLKPRIALPEWNSEPRRPVRNPRYQTY